MTFLLDVNVLLAATCTTHADHLKADGWVRNKQLATCPVSEAGLLRISTHPKALNSDMATARKLLAGFFEPGQSPIYSRRPARAEIVSHPER
jgi:predicted nucleic acid-binding protein